jgi:signal transduction histidine kinase/CheY-like chemotaxis protein
MAAFLNDPTLDEVLQNLQRTFLLRAAVILVGFPFAYAAMGESVAVWSYMPILIAEAMHLLAARPIRRNSEVSTGDRYRYLASLAALACVWVVPSVFCWISGDAALRAAAVSQWSAQLLYLIMMAQSSATALLMANLPVILTAFLLPVISPTGRGMTDLYGQASIIVCFGFVVFAGFIAHRQRTKLREATDALSAQKAAAEAANSSKSAFLATMSHEIRTPLNGVLGMAQCLQASQLTPEQEEQVGTILDSGQILMALLNDVLDITRIEAGKLEIVPATTDLPHKLARVYKLFQPQANDKGLHISFEVHPDVPRYISCDPVRLHQCFSNLVSNAIKFTETGEIAVTVKSEPVEPGMTKIMIEVRDPGIGMPGDTLKRLLPEFPQEEDISVRRFAGAGLGLPITLKLVRLMGGDITAESQPGAGSVFRFSFTAPIVERDSASKPSPSGKQGDFSLSGKRVLLVDDNMVNRKLATLFLRYWDVEVVEAENGLTALALLKDAQFDFVLLDMHMPVMDGQETIRQIRASSESWNRIPVIALTADVMRGDRVRYLAMGMNGLVTKPISQADLHSEIYRVLDQSSGFRIYDADDFAYNAPAGDSSSIDEDEAAAQPVKAGKYKSAGG